MCVNRIFPQYTVLRVQNIAVRKNKKLIFDQTLYNSKYCTVQCCAVRCGAITNAESYSHSLQVGINFTNRLPKFIKYAPSPKALRTRLERFVSSKDRY